MKFIDENKKAAKTYKKEVKYAGFKRRRKNKN